MLYASKLPDRTNERKLRGELLARKKWHLECTNKDS